jgi:cyanate permease
VTTPVPPTAEPHAQPRAASGGDRVPVEPARVEAAKRAVAVVFGVNGFLFASWVARLPAVRDLLHITPGRLGLLLLSISVGSVSTLLIAGFVVHRLGPRMACLVSASTMVGGLVVAAMTPAMPVLVVALALVGCGTGVWDVSMNVEGAGVERLLGRPVMPRFHAGFSLGTVGGAAGGAAAAALSIPVAVHVGVLAVLGLGVVVVALRSFLGPQAWGWQDADGASCDDSASEPAEAGGRKGSGVLQAWREPRTVMIGLLALGMAFAEGSANDWLALGLVDGYQVGHAVAALGFGVFVTAMTAARMVGPWTLTRFGRVLSLRTGALMVAAGVLAVVAGPHLLAVAGRPAALALAGVGALAWGSGAALGFPVAMSAASDEPRLAAARVSVVSTIGYLAFIAGPPLLGLLADHVGVVRALLGVGAAVLLSLAAAGAAREPAEADRSFPDAAGRRLGGRHAVQ